MGVLYTKINSVWLMVSGGKKEPYNEALALVGIGKAGSLEAVLSNSEYCTALAGNADARTIMKDNYSYEMTEGIETAWNDGLNTLNHACGLRHYWFKNGYGATSVSGGYTANVMNYGQITTQKFEPSGIIVTSNSKNTSSYAGKDNIYGGLTEYSGADAQIVSTNKLSGFSTIEITADIQTTTSGNVGGGYYVGLVSTVQSAVKSAGVVGEKGYITKENAHPIVEATPVKLDITNKEGYIAVMGSPFIQLGGGSQTLTLKLLDVVVYSEEQDDSIVYENGVLYDENVKTAGSYLTVNWNDGGQLSLKTSDNSWGGHWYLYGFQKPEGYSKLNILISSFTANDTRPWVRLYAQDTLNTSAQSINHNGNYSTTEAKPNDSNITLVIDKGAGDHLVCYGGVYNATQSTTKISKIWWSN